MTDVPNAAIVAATTSDSAVRRRHASKWPQLPHPRADCTGIRQLARTGRHAKADAGCADESGAERRAYGDDLNGGDTGFRRILRQTSIWATRDMHRPGTEMKRPCKVYGGQRHAPQAREKVRTPQSTVTLRGRPTPEGETRCLHRRNECGCAAFMWFTVCVLCG